MLFLSVRPTLFLVQSRSLSGRHVSTGFLDPVLGAMMKQVCWHSGRSKAYRGLPEARMAGRQAPRTSHEAGTSTKRHETSQAPKCRQASAKTATKQVQARSGAKPAKPQSAGSRRQNRATKELLSKEPPLRTSTVAGTGFAETTPMGT